MKKVERWKMEMPTEEEMLPKDKYTVFDRKLKRYRKGIHSKWHIPLGVHEVVCVAITLEDDSRGRAGKSGNWRVDKRHTLTICRGAQMDEGQSKTQPSWFLGGCGDGGRFSTCILSVTIPLASERRFGRTAIHSIQI
jgi:hypothetical protein